MSFTAIIRRQPINGENAELEIPVNIFCGKITNNGTEHPAYKGLKELKDNFTSIAVGGINKADRVSILGSGNGKISMNEYYGRNGNLISFPRITASFINRVTGEFKEGATFDAIFVVGALAMELGSDGCETGRLKVTGLLPQWGGKVDVVPFYTSNPKAIDAITSYWEVGSTVQVKGRLNFSSKVETVISEREGFGDEDEPMSSSNTINVSEFIITNGFPDPLEIGYDFEEIQKALDERKEKLARDKAKAEAKNSPTPAVKAPNKFDSLGF